MKSLQLVTSTRVLKTHLLSLVSLKGLFDSGVNSRYRVWFPGSCPVTTTRVDRTSLATVFNSPRMDTGTLEKYEGTLLAQTFAGPMFTKSSQVTHKEPEEVIDYAALGTVRFLRTSFDVLAGFKTGPVNEHKYLNRIIFLETVAGIPGMVAGALRHLSSLRRMKRDHGWIHTLLEEAENERMHLLTFLKLKKPGPMFRGMVIISQGVMFNLFFLTYLLSPKSCHRFVGYIEEEAVHTYTTLLEEIDNGKLPLFTSLPAPAIAKSYWGLDREAMFRDVILAVRADEANHRVVNHTFADMHKEFKQDAVNPFNVHSRVTEYSTASGLTPPPSIASTTDSDDPKAKGTRTAAETITKADRVHVKPL
ncbi:unnamed protein product [Discosporangium mesarthrocarpum]